jgi:hypothetical protein
MVEARVDETLPAGYVLIPRSLGMPISGPGSVEVRAAEAAVA